VELIDVSENYPRQVSSFLHHIKVDDWAFKGALVNENRRGESPSLNC
jgi:hypothetical protein